MWLRNLLKVPAKYLSRGRLKPCSFLQLNLIVVELKETIEMAVFHIDHEHLQEITECTDVHIELMLAQ